MSYELGFLGEYEIGDVVICWCCLFDISGDRQERG